MPNIYLFDRQTDTFFIGGATCAKVALKPLVDSWMEKMNEPDYDHEASLCFIFILSIIGQASFLFGGMGCRLIMDVLDWAIEGVFLNPEEIDDEPEVERFNL